ncbi:MAG: GntR family transcriptional regulator [Planctomycetes bacterium]|nr:GntR family transcriptional regulator [Planctomycetota bacterium]
MFPPFKRLQEQAYDHLRDMVLRNEFTPGVVYSETRVAEALGISRTPIRDALQRLHHDGLVDILPSKGFRIHALTYKDIMDIYQTRCAIEGFCARLIVAARDTPAGQTALRQMAEVVAQQHRLNDTTAAVADLVDLDYQLHLTIVSFPENRVFTQIYSNQMHRMRRITREGQEREERRRSSQIEHARLIDLMAQGTADEAYAGVVAHYQNMIDMARIATFHPELIEDAKLAGTSGTAAGVNGKPVDERPLSDTV